MGCANRDDVKIANELHFDSLFATETQTTADLCREKCIEFQIVGCIGFTADVFGDCMLVNADCEVSLPFWSESKYLSWNYNTLQ